MKKPKSVKKITRKWMENFANSIYNPKTKKYLRLCDGYLTNGPDPTNVSRKMHCGLGELYFAMTGQHANTVDGTRISEQGVCDMATGLVDFEVAEQRAKQETIKAIKSLKLKANVKDELIHRVGGIYHEADMSYEFQSLLESIPSENDDSCGHDVKLDEENGVYRVCTPAMFKNRSKRVAAIFRKAAKLIPE